MVRKLIAFLLVSQALNPAAGGTTTYYHPDALGSPLAATDITGRVLWNRQYRPFGDFAEVCASSCTVPDSRAFTGHEQGTSTDLLYMQVRFYDPKVGRFLSPDPASTKVGMPASLNRYAYAWNNPFRYVDPNGEEPYLVSRALTFSERYSHNFVVTNADFPGDANATVYSYGRTEDGTTGRVGFTTEGFSAGTHLADRAFWLSLADDPERAATFAVRVNATDEGVDAYAEALQPTTTYSPTTIWPWTTNSNSAASAVVNRASGGIVRIPQGDRRSPGARDWDDIDFDISRP